MYKRVVRARLRSIFDRINEGDYRAMIDGLAPEFVYDFHGDHALGGRRTTRDGMERWWQRMLRLLPGIRFEVRDILVDGAPWRTRVAVRSHVAGGLPDGSSYRNTVLQFLTLRWGKVTSVETLEDTQVLQRTLTCLAATGQSEAAADPIVD